MFGTATGILNWQPSEFWAATPHEYLASLDAWIGLNNPKAAEERERKREFAKLRDAYLKAHPEVCNGG